MSQDLVALSQADAFAIELKKLKQDITANDRHQAEGQLSLSRYTLSQYLNGKVRDNDTAAQIILFFKKQIAIRNLVLSDSVCRKTTIENKEVLS